MPVAVFAALAAGGLEGTGAVDDACCLAAAAVTLTVVARTHALAPALLLGLAFYLAVRALGWA